MTTPIIPPPPRVPSSVPPTLASIPEIEGRFVAVVFAIAAACCASGAACGAIVAHAQAPSLPVALAGPDAEQTDSHLETALLNRMRLGCGVYVAHCRLARGGCEARVRRLALAFQIAASRAGVDVWLLAAMALHESGLNVEAVGARGEHGPMQLHPSSPWGREAARQCRIAPSDCDAIEIGIAAQVLARALERCGGEAAALGMYNRGACGETSYSRVVLRLRDQLQGGES